MLLSMYLFYRYARSGKPRSYILEIMLFIIMISLFSTLFPVSFMVLFFPVILFAFPYLFLYFLSFPSFPFYFWYDELPAPAWLSPRIRELYPWLYSRAIRFLTINVALTPDWELSGDQIITHSVWDNHSNALVIAFSFFLLVNILGGLVGYFIGKKYRISDFSGNWLIIGVPCIIVSFIVAIFLESAGLALLGLGIAFLEMGFLSWIMEYTQRARVATLMIIGGVVLLLIGYPISHVGIIAFGETLVFFGIIIYAAKLAIAYARTHKPEG
jgi:hypothetical protein